MTDFFQGNTRTGKDEWLTPPELIKALGEFDLDPCAPINRPWDTAKKHFTIQDNGLLMDWGGGQNVRCFVNPPYGKEMAVWLNKCALHGNCIALTFVRTETNMFFNSVWPFATAMLFMKGRIYFRNVDGTKAGNAPMGSVLIAYGKNNAEVLQNCKIKGKFVWVNP